MLSMTHDPIRMVDLQSRHQEVRSEVERSVREVLDSGGYIGGPRVEEAEKLCASWLGRAEAVGTNSGTDALLLALLALNIGPGDEVIVPALTFFATAGAVCASGATPVVVDVGEDALIDPAAVRAALSPRTAAVIPVHLFGSTCPAQPWDVPVIDDAAQAIGAQPSPSTGVLTAVSTYPTKTWGGAGDGGFVVGDDPALLTRVRRLGSHGQTEPHLHERVDRIVGRNSRLDALQAAILLAHAPRVADRVTQRQQWARAYDENLPLGLRPLPRSSGSAVQQYVVLCEDRTAIQEALRGASIESAVYYPRPLNAQPALAGFPAHPTPVAERLSRCMLALPVHASLTPSEFERILSVLHKACS